MLLGICDMSLVKSSDLLDIEFMIMRKCNKRQQSGMGIDKNHLSVIVCVFLWLFIAWSSISFHYFWAMNVWCVNYRVKMVHYAGPTSSCAYFFTAKKKKFRQMHCYVCGTFTSKPHRYLKVRHFKAMMWQKARMHWKISAFYFHALAAQPVFSHFIFLCN